MSPAEVLNTVGQPNERPGTTFEYCMTGSRRATLTFDADGKLLTWKFPKLASTP